MLVTLVLISTLASAGAPAGHTDYNEWIELAPLPTPRALHMSAFLETDSGPRLYVVGGQRSASDPMEKACFEYSPRTNSWRARSDMRNARGLGQACAVDDEVYVLGGCATFGTPLAKVEAYHPTTNTWSVTGDMPDSLYDFATAVWRDSLVYVIGGGSWSPSLPPVDAVRLYNPATNTWRSASTLPVALGASCAGAVGDTLVVATGWADSGPTNRAWVGIIDTLNPAIILWQEIDTLPGARRCRAAGAVLDGRLNVAGGLELDSAALGRDPAESFRVLGDAWSCGPASGTWTALADKPHAVANAPAAASPALGRLGIAGGFPGALPYLRTVEALDLNRRLHDCAVTTVRSPASRMTPSQAVPVIVGFHNFGVLAESLPCRVSLYDSVSGSVAFNADTVVGITAGASLDVDFGEFVPNSLRIYGIAATAELAADDNRANDTLLGRARTTPGSDPDGYGYVYESTQEPDTVNFAWFDIAGATRIDEWDPNPDEGSSRRRLPFDFHYYGDSLDRIYVCTNGLVGFSDYALGFNRPLPFEAVTGMVAPFWDDLDLADTGMVYEKFSGDTALYTWLDVPRFNNGTQTQSDSGLLSFQVAFIYPGTIRFNYLRLTAACSSATIGIQGGDGAYNRYSEYLYDGEPARHLPVDSTSIVFRVPSSGVNELPRTGTRPCLSIRPNPASRILAVAVPPSTRRLEIVDITGRAVECLPTEHGQGSVEIDLAALGITPGVYLAVVETPGGRTAVKFIVTGPLP